MKVPVHIWNNDNLIIYLEISCELLSSSRMEKNVNLVKSDYLEK